MPNYFYALAKELQTITVRRSSMRNPLLNCNDLSAMSDVNEMYNKINDPLVSVYNKSFPIIAYKRSEKEIEKPYITAQLKLLIRNKRTLQRKSYKHPPKY